MKKLFLLFAMILMVAIAVYARGSGETNAKVPEQSYDGTGRAARAEVKIHTLLSPDYPISSGPDAEFNTILENYIFGEVFYHGSLTDRERLMILLAITTTNQNFDQFRGIAWAAVGNGILSPVEVKEVVYLCAPYIGFPKTISTLAVVNEIFTLQGITLPLESQSTVTEDTRFEKGLALQKQIYGDIAEQMRSTAPENQEHIYDYLTAMCFGDFYTRNGLDIKTREMLAFCILAALGDCDNQLAGHITGNLNVGNSKGYLVDVLTQCLPYIGFPRALNVLAILNNAKE